MLISLLNLIVKIIYLLLENVIIQLYEQEKIIEEDKVMFRESFDRDRTNCFHLRTPSKIKTLKKKKFC